MTFLLPPGIKGLKKLSSECEFDNIQDSLIKDIIVCGARDPFVKGVFRECDLALSKAISSGYAAEKTHKHAREIVRSQPTAYIDKIFKKKPNKSTHNTRHQNTGDFIKTCKFCDTLHPRGKCLAYGKVCHVCNKKSHFKVCCPRVGKKVHEIKKDESDELSDQSDYGFFIETVNIQHSAHIKNDWSITLPWNGIAVS